MTSGDIVKGGIKEQTEQVLKNLETVLKASGSSLDKVVKTTVFLKDMNDFVAMNEVYGYVSVLVFYNVYSYISVHSSSLTTSLLVLLFKLLVFQRMLMLKLNVLL